MIVALAGRLLAVGDDPLGPVDQDAENIRRAACRLVRPDSVCAPSATTPPEPGTSSGGGSNIASLFELVLWVMFFALIAALVFLIVRAVIASRRSPRRRRVPGAATDLDDVEDLPLVVVDRSREPAEWRREADDHRRAGRFRDAVRCRYRALVGDLARRGLVDEIPGRTSGEERSQMTVAAPCEATEFSAAAELFDRAWFGDAPVAEVDVERMEALEGRVLASAGGTPR